MGDNNQDNGGGDSNNSGSSEEHKLFVGGLSWNTTVDGLRDYFNKYGTINDAVVMQDKMTGRSRGPYKFHSTLLLY
tara:strand:- start:1432 stop:1659 length:228 start_codon:yes stop_codon:yes gene_type:complete